MKTREQMMDFIQNQKTAFIGSVDEDGFPNMKAMLAPRKIDGNCFYFSTNTSAMRSHLYANNPMEVLQDDDIKREIWQMGDTMYYKKGVTDPDYCVLKFTAMKGRHYCNFKSESFDIEDLG